MMTLDSDEKWNGLQCVELDGQTNLIATKIFEGILLKTYR